MSDNTDQPAPGPDEQPPFDIDSVAKDACLLVVRLKETLRPEHMAALKSALDVFSAENPNLPPFVILPSGMTIEAYKETNDADSVQP